MTRMRAALILGLLASSANAEASGTTTVTATTIWDYSLSVPANTAISFQTLNLAPSTADTVIHVQSSAGVFLAGNDDCTPGSKTSCLTVPGYPLPRTLVAYV